MNTKRTTLLIALLLAVVTGWLTMNYVRSVQQQTANSGEPRSVYVATAEIPARATITADMIQRVVRPSSLTEPDAINDPSAAIGQIALITIPAGGGLTQSNIGRAASGGLPVRLLAGKRAVSIQIDKVKGVSGLMQPGDRVDVIAVPNQKGIGDQPPPAATILRGIRILAVGTSLEYTSATPSPDEQSSTTVTLEVSPTQADLLAMADQNTTLRLALRPPHEASNSEPTEALRFPNLQLQNNSAPAQPPTAVAAASITPHDPPAQKRSFPNVMFIDGDRVSYGVDTAAKTPALDAQP